MTKAKRPTMNEAVETIAQIVETGLDKFPARERQTRLNRILATASNAGGSARRRLSGRAETLPTPLRARRP